MTKIIKVPKDLYGFLSTPGVELTNLVFASDDVVWIAWKYGAEEQLPSQRHTNDVIGTYVPAGKERDIMRHRICDIHSARAAQQLIETGDKLGDMTSELHPSESISEFACGGPNNYAYRVVDTVTGNRKTACKLRGITLNYNTSKLVNFDVIWDMILKGDEPSVINVHTEHKIKRKRKG